MGGAGIQRPRTTLIVSPCRIAVGKSACWAKEQQGIHIKMATRNNTCLVYGIVSYSANRSKKHPIQQTLDFAHVYF